jgi:hypothetical protein
MSGPAGLDDVYVNVSRAIVANFSPKKQKGDRSRLFACFSAREVLKSPYILCLPCLLRRLTASATSNPSSTTACPLAQ